VGGSEIGRKKSFANNVRRLQRGLSDENRGDVTGSHEEEQHVPVS
jgi:hypothetical protein